jgi:hypothetical protein
MHAVVRYLSSADPGADPLELYRPPAHDHFCLSVAAVVGPSDGPGDETFQLSVCSPAWIAEHDRPKRFEFLQATLVVDEWDLELVRRAIGDLCLHATGETWHEVAMSLSRSMHWEFADYSP